MSYSCTNNISKITYKDNKKLVDKSLIDNQRTNKWHYNCRNKEDCSMRGMCHSEKVVYQPKIYSQKNVRKKKLIVDGFVWFLCLMAY